MLFPELGHDPDVPRDASVRNSTPSAKSAMPKFRGAGPEQSRAVLLRTDLLEEREDGEPESGEEMAVRTTDMSVRSVLMRVRWKERRVRRDGRRND